ncbi:MAG: cell division protein ZapA [Gammaproteobacteria bacterium]|nr:cell division protein ZapA [Gammaproteobacteria bacterium]MBA3731205.1 cell division protein ZapA [Gammaproteobacteria bacterium]
MGTSIPVTVYILDKEYRVACPEDEHSALLASASLLNARMKQIRESGKVVGADRVAVIAALNLTQEFLNEKTSRETFSRDVTARIRSIENRIDTVLATDDEATSEAL